MSFNSLSVTGSPYYIQGNINFRNKKRDVENEEDAKQSSKSSETTESSVGSNASDAPKKDIYQRLAESKAEHQKAIESRDKHLKNATVNIAQILKDFRNTGLAIGTPQETMEEVDTYIELVKKQLAKNQPDTQMIKTNLKLASSLLDSYISETLQKPSKVVSNWVDAIFLQQVNYEYNGQEINPNFAVKFPQKQQAEETETIEETKSIEEKDKKQKSIENSKQISMPEDEELKNLFISRSGIIFKNFLTENLLKTIVASLDFGISLTIFISLS